MIVSVTIAGANADIIGAALESAAPFVDGFVVISTAGDAPTVRAAVEVAQLHDTLVRVREWPWRDDFAAARNYGLDVATEIGARWAMPLDTDERYETNGEDIRATLAAAEAAGRGALMMRNASGYYSQCRAMRLPCAVRYVGETHEAFAAHKLDPGEFKAARFDELPKTPERLRAKFERDLRILGRMRGADDRNSRTLYYLGESCRNLGLMAPPDAAPDDSKANNFQNAIHYYDLCADVRGWDEESAFACYRAAECLCSLDRYQAAIDRCAAGLARHPGVAELAWLAGFASYKLARYAHAIAWCRMAIANGYAAGDGEDIKRIGFKHLPGLYDGPFDVMHHAALQLGRTELAELALVNCHHARDARVAFEKGPAKHAEPTA